MSKIIYTMTDEAPSLATYSFYPIIKAFTATAGIGVELHDISLAGRIIANFPDYLTKEQQAPDVLAQLGELVKDPVANLIKLPNISASIPQLKQAVEELQSQGYKLPAYPEKPKNAEERDIRERYDRIKGSAVNPVLREGNSDRRAPQAVKNYARNHPHSMGVWSHSSQSHVANMSEGDFYGSEQSRTMTEERTLRIELHEEGAQPRLLKDGLRLQKGEIIDAACMSYRALRSFLKKEMQDAQDKNVLFSLHLKATMMKISDPLIFGCAVSVFFEDVFEKYSADFATLGVSANNGLGDLLAKLESLPSSRRSEIQAAIATSLENGPDLAMVNSDKGISNLHVPSDIIIDASMPAAIRSSGQMWGPDGKLRDMKAIIPDRCYAGVYQKCIEFCQSHGAFDPVSMGSVSNVGLMAQKAEEYGSHDKTFEIPVAGELKVSDEEGNLLFNFTVEKGDIFRMCQAKDAPIQDWVKLAVGRAKTAPAIFWLDKNRAHDRELIKKVENYLSQHNTEGLNIAIMSPVEATVHTLQRIKEGKDCVAVTGNVLRDYLTDLFPILELGTSAKMLSIVPLMNGGGLFETGAGGSAPKHVQQFRKEGHLRWDSLGEFLALAASFEHLSGQSTNPKALILARTLDAAIEEVLEHDKSPKRRVHELDNRGSHYYLARYWARALSKQQEDAGMAAGFRPLAAYLESNEELILAELLAAQGEEQDLGGYYLLDHEKANKAMRPSETLNAAWTHIALDTVIGDTQKEHYQDGQNE